MRKKFPVLQVALDFINLARAIKAGEEALRGGADWIEAGTPLIKSEGMNALRALRERFSDAIIVADMKTMDVGALEVSMAAKAGANIISILGAADDETVIESVEEARNYGVEIMADLIGCKEAEERAKVLEKLGVDYLCVHVGVDEQMRARDPLMALERIAHAVGVPVAAAGGINSEIAGSVVEHGADIVIVGGAIIKAPDIAEATRKIKRAIVEKKNVRSQLYKKYGYAQLRDAFMRVSTANICDAMHKRGFIDGVFPICRGLKMVGTALTVKTMDGDWAKPVEAIDLADKNTVIVISAGKRAVWGELATWSCKVKGVAGVVVYGGVRDVEQIREINYPIFARYICAEAGDPKGFGEIGCEVVCGGQRIRNGDWIIGDDNGVVVVPKERALEVANRAIDVMEREDRIREEIKRGGSLASVLELLRWEKRG
ncbi:MAG: bifunctional hexulose-6-phosphate synthase/ribonuclease regulator [Thermoplasmata archaeon]|nr:MAG: bifunctional hexulose-6-phosphate synthase/ribonuclease regulator [Thermoplasmata archaeon]